MPKRLNWNLIASKIRQFYRQARRAPSIEEIRRLFGYRSKNTAHWLAQKLVERGWLKKDRSGRLLMDGLRGARLLGEVQAGFPSPAEEELVDTLSLDDYLIKNPDQTFLIKVTGDSMIDAGIHPGDLVVVERGRTPEHNDIVIAQVDGEWTIKYLHKRGASLRLVPANANYPVLSPKDELKIGGVVTACLRRYK